MKQTMIAALIGATLLTRAWPLNALDAFQQNARLGRGVNILGWDAYGDPAHGQFKDVPFKLINETGFHHVRVSLHPLQTQKWVEPLLDALLPKNQEAGTAWLTAAEEAARKTPIAVEMESR